MEKVSNGKLSDVMDTAGDLVPGDTLVVRKKENGLFSLTKKGLAVEENEVLSSSPPLFLTVRVILLCFNSNFVHYGHSARTCTNKQ